MEAIFTQEAIDKFNLPKTWEVVALESEQMSEDNLHYSIKVRVAVENEIEIDYYNLDYIENSKDILDYFYKQFTLRNLLWSIIPKQWKDNLQDFKVTDIGFNN